MAIDKNGQPLVIGGFSGTVQFGSTAMTNTGSWAGLADMFIAKVISENPSDSPTQPSAQEPQLYVFPNPSSTNFCITYSGHSNANLTLCVRNTLGQLIYSKNYTECNSFSETLDVRQLSKGVYFIELRGERILEVRKIIVQ